MSPTEIAYRDVSCTCSSSYNCDCYELKRFKFDLKQSLVNTQADTRPNVIDALETPLSNQVNHPVRSTFTLSDTGLLFKPTSFSSEHVGGYCVVMYDQKPYPGRIHGLVDDEIEVDCMKATGRNRFFWPGPRKDINTYPEEDILCMTPSPEYQAGRRPYFRITRKSGSRLS